MSNWPIEIIAPFLSALAAPPLDGGNHAEEEPGACIMEVVSLFKNQGYKTDLPRCVPEPIAYSFQRANDILDEESRQSLTRFLPRLCEIGNPWSRIPLLELIARDPERFARLQAYLSRLNHTAIYPRTAPTPQQIAENQFLNAVWKRLQEVTERSGETYDRYQDDLNALCALWVDEHLPQIVPTLAAACHRDGLNMVEPSYLTAILAFAAIDGFNTDADEHQTLDTVLGQAVAALEIDRDDALATLLLFLDDLIDAHHKLIANYGLFPDYEEEERLAAVDAILDEMEETDPSKTP